MNESTSNSLQLLQRAIARQASYKAAYSSVTNLVTIQAAHRKKGKLEKESQHSSNFLVKRHT